MKYDIMGIGVENVTMQEAVCDLSSFLCCRENKVVVTPNAEIMQMCFEDNSIMAAVAGADYVVPDGVGVLYAAKVLGTPLKQKVAGIDLAWLLLGEAEKKKVGVFFFGSLPGVAEKAARKAKETYKELIISGTRHGYFDEADNAEIIQMINDSKAGILFVCLGAPKQEKWMMEHKDQLNLCLMMGLGGSLNIFAGITRRAPRWIIRMRLEWLHRFVNDPKRIGRMMRLPKLVISVKKESIRRKRAARTNKG